MDAAAIRAAVARDITPPSDLPDRCRDHFKTPKDPAVGEPWVGYRGKVHIAARAINSQIDGCAAWWDDYRAGLKVEAVQ